MKIIIATGIYPPEIGGPATYVREIARALVARGDTVSVVTYGDARTEKGDGWNVDVVSRTGGAIIRYLRYAWRVFLCARSADLVYLQGPVSEGFPGTIGAMLAGTKTIMKMVGDYAWEQYQQHVSEPVLLDAFLKQRHGGSVGLLEQIERWTARHARRVIVPSRYLKGVVAAWGVSEDRITVVYNSISSLPSVDPRDALRSTLGVGENVVILTAVRAVPWKGVDFLLSVLKDLSPSHLLVVAGDGPSLGAWKKEARDQGITDRVRFLGRVDRETLATWYAAADVFALASGYEGFPHVVVEAVSVGLPCVVSDQGGNPETAELFPDHVRISPYRDVAAWAAALRTPVARCSPIDLTHDHDRMISETVDLLHSYATTV